LPAAAAVLVPAAPFVAAAAVGNNGATTTTTTVQQETHAHPNEASPPGTNEIDYVDVGQGDGVVMRIGGKFILSDAGQHNVSDVDTALHNLGASKVIDVAILSHAHSDHVKNVTALVKNFGWEIKTVALSQSTWWQGPHSPATNQAVIDDLKKSGTTFVYVNAGQHFTWGGADWEILSPPAGKYTEDGQVPDSSVVYVLHTNGDAFLFTGDIGKSVATTVAKRWTSEQLGRANVFLATHHGSAAGSNDDLLEAVRPTWAVLSTGPNGYGHPSPAAIKRLEAHNITIWCTDANGTTRVVISKSGALEWHASKQQAAWWSATTNPPRETGSCVGR
jgi:competence protein ComEC